MNFRGVVKVDTKTKNLVKRIKQGEIAVICHNDIDEVAANSLIERRVRAVINTGQSTSGKYPNLGPLLLISAGIPLLDVVNLEINKNIADDDFIEVIDKDIYKNNQILARGFLLSKEYAEEKIEEAKGNMEAELDNFIDNTLEYAKREKKFIIQGIMIPQLRTILKDRHVLVVVRGKNYKEDLRAIRSYIKEINPVLIGVDGGGDALLEFSLIPDIILGDMDSVSDKCLKMCNEIIVHAYADGRAPGMERIEKMGLSSKTIKAPGTSEDIAFLLAYELGAELIVAVGSHSNMIDFLEKGRKGMASTFLTRLKIGSILIDAKGVSKLYQNSIKLRYVFALISSAVLPALAMIVLSTPMQQFFRLLQIRIRVMIGL